MATNSKIVLIGNAGVGKTSIITRFVFNEFNPSSSCTIIPGFYQKNIYLKNSPVPFPLQIWDTAGQEVFRSTTKAYYKQAAAAIVVYDLTDNKSFIDAQTWIKEVKDLASENITIVLVGSKLDLLGKQEMLIDEAEEYAKKNKIKSMIVSSKDDINIRLLFEYVAQEISLKPGTMEANNRSKNGLEGIYSSSTSYTNMSGNNIMLTSSFNHSGKRKDKCC